MFKATRIEPDRTYEPKMVYGPWTKFTQLLMIPFATANSISTRAPLRLTLDEVHWDVL